MANNFPNLLPSLNIDMVNGIYVDPRITFSRAGTRTYYGQEVVKAEENLFIRSQEFSNAAWIIDAVTLSAVTAPDGTSTASKVLPTAVSSAHYIYGAASNKPKLASTTYTTSVRIKADGYDFATVSIAGTGSSVYVAATFDLSGAGAVTKTGVGGSGGTLVGSSITALAGGWYQCTVTGSVTQAAGFDLISVATTGTPTYGNYGLETFTGDGTSAIQIWGAQLEQRSFATAYTATTTQPITRYQRQLKTAAANEWPREFDPVTGECLGRSVWESRTNLLQRSQEFDNAYWTQVAVTVSPNQIIAPDGTLTVDKLISTAVSGFHSINRSSGTRVASTAYTYSFFAKAAEIGFCLPNFSSGLTGTALSATINLTTGAATSVSAGLTVRTVLVGNGFYRISITATGDANTTAFNATINTTDAAGNGSHTGDGYSGIYIWGAQLETGAFATPYIPTVAAQVTRVADSAVMTGVNFSSWFNPEQGCFYVQGSSNNTANARYLMTTATAGDNRFMVYTDGASAITGSVITNGATQALLSRTGLTITNNNAFALSYNTDDFKAVANGGVVGTDTAGVVPVANTLFIGQRETGVAQISGYIKRLTYYPQALTAANLQAITR
jgi:hypothetical protein